MNTSFRKLIRIAIILISLIILFNFFGYFLIRSKSEENEKKSSMVGLAARQRMLSQSIIKDAVLLLSISSKGTTIESLKINLNRDLAEFTKNSKLLRGEVTLPDETAYTNSFEIKRILAKSQTYIKSLLAVGNEIAAADSMLLAI